MKERQEIKFECILENFLSEKRIKKYIIKELFIRSICGTDQWEDYI